MGMHELDCSGLGQGLVTGNGPLGPIKCGEFLD
jgi:hypothetical protein